MTKKLFFIIVCILFPVLAEGVDWTYIISTRGTKFYIDVNSIETINSFSKGWFKQESKNIKGEYAIVYQEFDCKTKRIRFLQISSFRKEKLPVSQTNNNPEWQYVKAESAHEAELQFICTHKKGVLNIPRREDNQDDR